MQLSKKRELKLRIKRRIRKKVRGMAERPRLSVFRSNRYIYAQLLMMSGGLRWSRRAHGKLRYSRLLLAL